MVIHYSKNSSDHLPNWPQELSSFNDRDINWCYNFFMSMASKVNRLEKESALLNYFFSNMSRNALINVNGFDQQFNYNTVAGLKQGNVVDISWIDKKDGRLLNWLMSSGMYSLTVSPTPLQIGHYGVISVYSYPFMSPVPAISVEQQYGFIVEYIDSIRFGVTDASYKQSWLNGLKDLWVKVKTPATDLKWLKQDNDDQLLWAWNYLKEQPTSAFVPPPANNREYYNAILASLDAMTILDAYGKPTAEKQLFVAKFKKAWSQKKFRASGKAKKLYHLPLTENVKECLEKLSLIKNCTESDLLEELINREYVAICLDAQGNEKY